MFEWIFKLLFGSQRKDEIPKLVGPKKPPEPFNPHKEMLLEGHNLGDSGSVEFSKKIRGHWRKMGPKSVSWDFFYEDKSLEIVGASKTSIFQLISPNHISNPYPTYSSWLGWDRTVHLRSDGSTLIEISILEPTNVYDKLVIIEAAVVYPNELKIIWGGFRETEIVQEPHVD